MQPSCPTGQMGKITGVIFKSTQSAAVWEKAWQQKADGTMAGFTHRPFPNENGLQITFFYNSTNLIGHFPFGEEDK